MADFDIEDTLFYGKNSPFKAGFDPFVAGPPRLRGPVDSGPLPYWSAYPPRDERLAEIHLLESRFFLAVEEIAKRRGYVYQSPAGKPGPAVTLRQYTTLPSGVNESTEAYFEGQAVPTLDEAVRGWRAWTISGRRKGRKEGEPTLRSITYKTQWLPQIAMHAHCNRAWSKQLHAKWAEDPHSAPERNCQCGLYAKLTAKGAAKWAATMVPFSPFTGGGAAQYAVPVVGTVQMWGKVLLYTEGFRAEYAYPYHLFIPRHFNADQVERWDSADRLAARLRSLYACDVEVVDFTPPNPPPGTDSNPYSKGSA